MTPLDTIPGMVAAARAAQPGWQFGKTKNERVALLKAAVGGLGASKDALAAMITAEMGKISEEAAEEAEGAVNKGEFLDNVSAANEPQARPT